MKKLLFLIPLSLCAQTSARVGDPNFNAWAMYFGNHKTSDKWGLHLEGQWRRAEGGLTWQQLLLRPGVNYYLNDNVTLTLGYAYIRSYPYGDFPTSAAAFPEHRVWQQLLIRHKTGRVNFQQRYRTEQRWISTGAAWRTQDRFRYMVRGDIPLKGRWSLGLYNELWVNYGRNLSPNFFDQNRAYAALGYNTGTKLGRLEFGYMNQTLAQRNGRVLEYNHTLQLALFSTAPFRKK